LATSPLKICEANFYLAIFGQTKMAVLFLLCKITWSFFEKQNQKGLCLFCFTKWLL